MKHTHENGTPFTKEEFLEKLKIDKDFSDEFGNKGIDQISELNKQLRENPDSRRLQVNAWAVHDLPKMVLPPCHYGFQVYTRELSFDEFWDRLTPKQRGNMEKPYEGETYNGIDSRIEFKNIASEVHNLPTRAISLMWNQRSVDTFLGLPFNIASYGLLLEIIAKEVNMVPDELIGNLGDVHLYSNHIDAAKEQIGREYTFGERLSMLKQAMTPELYEKRLSGLVPFGGGVREYFDMYQIPYTTREPFPLPILSINTEFWKTQSGECGVGPLDTNLQGFEISDFEIINYQSHPTIKAPLSN